MDDDIHVHIGDVKIQSTHLSCFTDIKRINQLMVPKVKNHT